MWKTLQLPFQVLRAKSLKHTAKIKKGLVAPFLFSGFRDQTGMSNEITLSAKRLLVWYAYQVQLFL
jgi:hypothetical protein